MKSFDKFMEKMKQHVDISAGLRDRDTIKIWNGLELRRRQVGKIVVTQIAKVGDTHTKWCVQHQTVVFCGHNARKPVSYTHLTLPTKA